MKTDARGPASSGAGPLRLDDLHPALAPLPALPAAPSVRLSPPALSALLRQSLAHVYRLPIETISLAAGTQCVLEQVTRAAPGPIVAFPPSSSATTIAALSGSCRVIPIVRGWGPEEALDAATATDLPGSAIAWIESPSDPLGALATAADIVRLARACRGVVVDERLAEFAARSLLPLAAEFDNIVVLRSLPAWPAPQRVGCWAAGSSLARSRVGLEERLPTAAAAAVILTTLTNSDTMAAPLRQVRAERSRLYRMLRKFSFVEPAPSWGPFIAARIDLMPRAQFVAELAGRNIRVHVPREEGLERYVRIGIGSRSATDRLQAALRAMAPAVLG
jgi:histidinol-phosphate/aromatic aminotransferase/cobyric acid decarboxylase-like protein